VTLIIRAITMYFSSILLLQLLDSIRRDIRFTSLFDRCC